MLVSLVVLALQPVPRCAIPRRTLLAAAAAPAPSDRESPPPIVTFEQLTRPPEPPPYAPPHRPAEQPLADLSRAQADKAAGKPDWATLAPRPQPARTQAPEAQPVQAQTVQAQPLQAQPLQAQAIDAQAIHAQAPHPQPGEAPAPGQPQAAAAGTDRASGLGAVAAAVQPTLTVLHVGCGPPNPNALPAALRTQNWRELRLDANAEMQPDIVASITDMRQVADGSMDAVYSSHNLEHVFPHEAPLALAEFCRVLKPDGLCLLLCPDLQTIGQMIAEGRLLEPIYHSPAGPIAPIDMLYGHRASMAAGNLYMAHRNGFSASSLTQLMQEAGFAKVAVTRDPARFSLWGLGFRIDIGDALVARCQANLGIGHPALPPPRG